jgi:hypothetical protein
MQIAPCILPLMANIGDAKPKIGNRVILTELPPGFVDDLPEEDQQAIKDAVGKPVRLSGYDEEGRAELEFKDRNRCFHTMYVDPEFIRMMSESERDRFEDNTKDISSVFDHYRSNVRAIWNMAFWPDADLRNWDSIDQFHEIEKLLFDAVVLAKLDLEWPLCDLFVNPISFFQIVPSIAHGTPILIQKPRPGAPTGYWDDPVNLVKPREAELQFIAYFDWDQMDYIDLRYYRVKIASFDAHPELVSREALIERQQATVHLSDEIGFARSENGPKPQ